MILKSINIFLYASTFLSKDNGYARDEEGSLYNSKPPPFVRFVLFVFVIPTEVFTLGMVGIPSVEQTVSVAFSPVVTMALQ